MEKSLVVRDEDDPAARPTEDIKKKKKSRAKKKDADDGEIKKPIDNEHEKKKDPRPRDEQGRFIKKPVEEDESIPARKKKADAQPPTKKRRMPKKMRLGEEWDDEDAKWAGAPVQKRGTWVESSTSHWKVSIRVGLFC